MSLLAFFFGSLSLGRQTPCQGRVVGRQVLLYRSPFEPLPEQPSFYGNTEWKALQAADISVDRS